MQSTPVSLPLSLEMIGCSIASMVMKELGAVKTLKAGVWIFFSSVGSIPTRGRCHGWTWAELVQNYSTDTQLQNYSATVFHTLQQPKIP